MDKIQNPFSPGAGSPPPELAGRDSVLEQAKVLLEERDGIQSIPRRHGIYRAFI